MLEFGGNWTKKKLERLEKYLSAYTRIMSRHNFKFAYIDAFAGTGYRSIKQRDENDDSLFPEFTDDFIGFAEGSAKIALDISPEFEKYIFIEKDVANCAKLEALKNEYPDKKEKIIIKNEEANSFISKICQTNWKNHRAVMFLDPFGMDVDWETIMLIAKTEAIDLWYLFPLGMGINRLLTKNSLPSEGFQKKLNKILGTDEWIKFYKEIKVSDLFGEQTIIKKDADFNKLSNFIVERLSSCFCGVAKNPLMLYNSTNNPIFLLCFASGNLKGSKTAIKIAEYILKDE